MPDRWLPCPAGSIQQLAFSDQPFGGVVNFLLFYYQINLAFFCKKAFKHQGTKKKQKAQRKIIFSS